MNWSLQKQHHLTHDCKALYKAFCLSLSPFFWSRLQLPIKCSTLEDGKEVRMESFKLYVICSIEVSSLSNAEIMLEVMKLVFLRS